MVEAPLPELTLLAPVDGHLVALDQVPDSAFASKLSGDGVAIEATDGTLRAPCAGRVVSLDPSNHALSLRTSAGDLILLQVGIDTVKLDREGITPRVLVGDEVRTGQPLLTFDLDVLADRARAALTLMLVTEGRTELEVLKRDGPVVSAQDPVLRLAGGARPGVDPAPDGEPLTTEPLTLLNPGGLHARSAARLVARLRQFQAEVMVHKGSESARASSISDLLSLDVARGETLSLTAIGPDAAESLMAARELIEGGFGENLDEPSFAVAGRFESTNPDVIGGLPASPGLAIGRVEFMCAEPPDYPLSTESPALDQDRLRQAIERVAAELAAAKESFELRGEQEKAQIFAAHAELLADEALAVEALEKITCGSSAAAAFRDTIQARGKQLRELRSPLLQQRAADLEDIGSRVVFELAGAKRPIPEYDRETVLVAAELTPSDVAHLEPEGVAGLVTIAGGPSSHAAIIARSLSIPYVAGVGELGAKLVPGTRVIVNGDQGFIHTRPSEDALKDAESELARRRALREHRLAKAHQRASTLDGRQIEVAANIGTVNEAAHVIEEGADGVGLLRSEFLFFERRTMPSENEQRATFEEIARALGPTRSLVVRTLDVGGDKPLSFLPLEPEENPYLGVRGIRLSLRHTELFDAQLRAILAAAKHTRLHVMFPMIAHIDEFRQAKARLIAQAEGMEVGPLSVGIMVEVPSAALLADVFAKEVDFFSIGTNDLTQYALAVDRGHPELGAQADALDPAVLRLIKLTADAGAAFGKWVGVCGGLASETLATPLLVGLGITELSAPAPVAADLKAAVRGLRYADCQALATEALGLASAKAVRELLVRFNA
jgi:phosphoenolpyruvate-protein phosphotransferase